MGLRYLGKLSRSNKIFDKNTNGKPFRFILGKGQVIRGWDIGITGMRVGGERKLTIPSHLAYGKRGMPPDIPPNSELIFNVSNINMIMILILMIKYNIILMKCNHIYVYIG